MFDSEKAIKEWRKRMMRVGVHRGALAELEEHLREAVQRNIDVGEKPERAFEIAERELGEPESVSREFSKIEDSESSTWRKATAVAIATVLLSVAALIDWRHVSLSPALWIHVFSVTGGYSCVLLAGCLGMFLVLRDFLNFSRNENRAAVRDSARLCYSVALLLVLVGLLSGSIWSKGNTGNLWGGSREAGTVLILAWTAGTLLAIGFWTLSSRSIASLCLMGLIITCAAWFATATWTPLLVSFVGIAGLIAAVSGVVLFSWMRRRSLRLPEFDEFAELGRRATELAHEEAVNLGHDYVGTEHLLLGAIACESGVLIDVLHKWAMDGSAVRNEVEHIISAGRHRISSVDLPYTPRAKRALTLAAQQAKILGHECIAPEHIFLGLLLEGEGVAGLVLRKLGFEPDKLRHEISERMSGDGEGGALSVPA